MIDLLIFLLITFSAGIGRTGCFIAASVGITQLMEDHTVDILGIVSAMRIDRYYPFKPSRCIKASFYNPENILYFPTIRGFRMKIPMQLVYNTWQLSLICNPLQIIFIHYKSRIATAIRGLYWMKMTMVNSGLKGLILTALKYFCINQGRLADIINFNKHNIWKTDR